VLADIGEDAVGSKSGEDGEAGLDIGGGEKRSVSREDGDRTGDIDSAPV